MSEKKPTVAEVPAYLLERLAHGELPEEQVRTLRERLEKAEGPGALEIRLAALRAADDVIRAEHPVGDVSAEVRRRLSGAAVDDPATSRSLWSWMPPLVVLGAAAAMLLFARGAHRPADRPLAQHTRDHGDDVIRLRGLRSHLVIYRLGESAPQVLAENDKVRAGDRLQIAYLILADAKRAEAPVYGVVVSVDSRGAVNLHLPVGGGISPRLRAGAETLLPYSYELDATPGTERFVLVVSERPFATDAVVRAVAEKQPLPAGTTIFEKAFAKEIP